MLNWIPYIDHSYDPAFLQITNNEPGEQNDFITNRNGGQSYENKTQAVK